MTIRIMAVFVVLCGCSLDWSGGPGDDDDDAIEVSVDGSDESQDESMENDDTVEDVSQQEGEGEIDEDVDAGLLCTSTCNLRPLPGLAGYCNDGGPGAHDGLCDYGTDCEDCGPRVPR